MSCQQYELYASEASVPRGREFPDAASCQQWLDGLTMEPWWQRFYSQVVRIEVGFIPSGKCSVGGYFPDRAAGRIEMLPVHRSELFLCHEMAHVLAHARFGQPCGHSPWFAKVYLELVYLIMGSEAWTALRDAFVAGGIEFDPDPGDFELGRRREVGAAA